MLEPTDTISESIAGIGRIRQKLTAISGMLDNQYDELESLFNHLQNSVIDISQLSPEEVGTLALCLVEAYSARYVRRFEQEVTRQIAMRN